ncbi:putative transposase (plasmid) [Nostoc carneum NIES-2107]|nr:putative transposase [Nostoc carneum NIES-2107]BAY29604.1 putative transposase [Nostoc carneum NIES-2107]BAY30436.1 putative transposase [Nostoc carneum NIES-2107]BAY31286.1 putative transposase [Nostoc carneum NIES-2107]BAY31440.1 putative transposase [Nostoc carneum NIES-2107]
MRPVHWHPPTELNAQEQKIVKRIKRAKLFTFLRQYRHQLFDEEFQEELSKLYADSPKGHPPVPPAQLALVTILQAYTGASDAEAIEALLMDRRWQLVLDCIDCEQAPFSQATLARFRTALIIQGLDRRLIEKTVKLAEQSKGFGSRQLRAALDSSPLWGASKVEDTYNLLGHALKKAIGVIAVQQGRGLAEVAQDIGVDMVATSSLKAALDLNWDDPDQKNLALGIVLDALERVETFVQTQPTENEHPLLRSTLETARQIETQDVEVDANGEVKLRSGVAKERRISVEDEEMRHGRKSRSQKIDGYKRHVLRDLDNGMIRAVGITKANVPEASVTDAITQDLQTQDVELTELHIDRAYLSSSLVKNRSEQLSIYCKAWVVHNGTKFGKTAFVLDWDNGTICCPNQVTLPFSLGAKIQFPQEVCATCPLRESCTSSPRGRSISIHPEEQLFRELRERQLTPIGRAKLRERVCVEHSLSHIGRWQGEQARYVGCRKNLFDLRRVAVVHNLHVLAKIFTHTTEPASTSI